VGWRAVPIWNGSARFERRKSYRSVGSRLAALHTTVVRGSRDRARYPKLSHSRRCDYSGGEAWRACSAQYRRQGSQLTPSTCICWHNYNCTGGAPRCKYSNGGTTLLTADGPSFEGTFAMGRNIELPNSSRGGKAGDAR
jgi:hypothetical protein